jgi:hypothetical protein
VLLRTSKIGSHSEAERFTAAVNYNVNGFSCALLHLKESIGTLWAKTGAVARDAAWKH